jgi:glutathione S-transferase
MATIQNFDQLHRAANARFSGQPINTKGGGRPNLHLYHAANSICSQKVRAVLLATDQPFISHSLDIFKGETYDPDYVRLRLMGCDAARLPLVTGHTGSTSATTSGCDACVVPTIIAEDSNEVLVDSKNICVELDRRNSAAPSALMTEHLKKAIEAEMSIVDDLPNFQLFLAAMAKPGTNGADRNIAIAKVQRWDTLIAENAGDVALCSAYAAKRAKEQAAADRLFEATSIDRAKQRIETAMRDLDVRLKKNGGPYVLGASLTLADLFWGVELLRVDDLGMSSLWSDGKLPTLQAYFQRLSENPALYGAVTQWPGARLKKK